MTHQSFDEEVKLSKTPLGLLLLVSDMNQKPNIQPIL